MFIFKLDKMRDLHRKMLVSYQLFDHYRMSLKIKLKKKKETN